MSDDKAPVVMIGVNADGVVGVVGIYETEQAARLDLQGRGVPPGYYYSLVTPAMNTCRQIEVIAKAPNVRLVDIRE